MAERTPNRRASYDAVATTPRPPTPPTTTGLPRSEGLSRCSTEAKKASRWRCITDASGRMAATYRSAPTEPARPSRTDSRARSPSTPCRRDPSAHRCVAGHRPESVQRGTVEAMTTTLTARGPADLLAAVPVVLGFHPSDSLVMLTFEAAHSFHARVDLPPPDEVPDSLPELLDALLAPALGQRVGRVAFVLYSGDVELSARVGEALCGAFLGAGIGVIGVLRAHDRTWCLVPPHRGLSETAPTPYDDTSHPFAARAVFEGLVTHDSRDALRDTLAALPDAVARVQALQTGSGCSRPDDVGWVRELVVRCATTGEALDDRRA